VATNDYRIAVIPGDGVGAEVVPAALRVLDATIDASGDAVTLAYEHFPWGSSYYGATGRMMDPDALERLQAFDAILFGAVGWPTVPDHISLWGLRLAICQGFDQYACVRPVRLLPGVPSPLRDASDLDWVVVRENTEGEYSGIGGRTNRGKGHGVAIQSSLFTEAATERIIRFAFDLARTRARPKVTSATKSNAQQYGMVLWDEMFDHVAASYPDVETERWLIDSIAARFVLRPETLEVVVASNLFGDILSDLGAALTGGLGIAPSANLDPTRRHPSMFEPVHGSAPDIAGRGIANPVGQVLSAAMMLEHLGHRDMAERIVAAVSRTTASGVLTPDVGGNATTSDVADAIIANL
jgi:tartrate dehydrogenase/decarboxylase/D-malate dehydrogenase